MPRIPYRPLLGPLLAVCVSGGVVLLAPAAADAATNGVVRVASGALRVRIAPTAASKQAGALPNRWKVSIACKVTGQYVKGAVRATAQWDRLTSGRYISHAYVVSSASIPTCAARPTPPPASPSAPSGPLTTASNAAFIQAAVVPAQVSQREFRVPASVTIAQAILESGWGKSGLAYNDRNYFGMKCFGNPGPIAVGCHDYQSSECDATTCWPQVSSFRVYNSVADSFRDHGRQLATLSRYAAAFAYPNDPNRFIAEVHKGGYATDPEYTNKLVRIMTNYNLYQYDLA